MIGFTPPSIAHAGVCDGGELSQGPHHRAGQDRNTSEIFQPEAGRGADQEPAAQRARPLGEAGAAVSGARATAGRCQEEGQTGAVLWGFFFDYLLLLRR